MYVFLQYLSTMNTLDPIFLSHVVSTMFASDLPEKIPYDTKYHIL